MIADRHRGLVVLLGLGLAACAGPGSDAEGFGRATVPGDGSADDGDETGGWDGSGDDDESDGGSSGGETGSGECPGECIPGQSDNQPCGGECGQQQRTCLADCSWGAWSMCTGFGECSPGATETCGPCQQRTCGPTCEWGSCEAGPCAFECIKSVRNGSEICDDAAFDMADEPMYLVCNDDLGGVGYISSNTGPKMDDCIKRCQGWEVNGMNAWDHLDYVIQMDCDQANKFIEVPLDAGQNAWVGVHDQPMGGGHFTEVCVATLAQ